MHNIRQVKRIVIALLLVVAVCSAYAQKNPKREFRGAWIQCVNGQFIGLGTTEMQRTLSSQLDYLQQCGINVIMFQVRAEGDALYASAIEPWSRFLTGRQGTPPQPYWDPLEWMVEQCHRRGMECHAWINPYRAKTKTTNELAVTHPAVVHPERCFEYDGIYIFDPGLAENRDYICGIAADIVKRYDVDGLHIDDYFYPYPSGGKQIPDQSTFERYGSGFAEVGDWRRDNVNKFIQQLYETVHAVKPWVKFGVSPFGIYRNQKSDPDGSRTNGLQNYDDLYADVLLWVEKGWVDYNVPQIYWEIGNKAADYDTLIRWWSAHAGQRPLIIGQDVERTVKFADIANPSVNQMQAKYTLQRALPNVAGSCQWYAKAVCDHVNDYSANLRRFYHRTPALQPLMPWIDNKAPKKVRSVEAVLTSDGYVLFWTEPKAKREEDRACKYVVYRFNKGEKVDLEDVDKIVALTTNTYYKLPYVDGTTKYTYVVTALDRLHNESKPVKKTIKL
ncbi:MAG: family 10 glycosylhydrolase [Bacteroidaceae bacterium]|nr:family 10 glycosylhydrolase [Bacteroidaceae bacterium]